MPDLISLKPMTYRHRALRPGAPFTVPTDIEARLLKRCGCAIDAAAEPGLDPEPGMGPSVGPAAPARPKLRRKPQRYQRRDLRADD